MIKDLSYWLWPVTFRGCDFKQAWLNQAMMMDEGLLDATPWACVGQSRSNTYHVGISFYASESTFRAIVKMVAKAVPGKVSYVVHPSNPRFDAVWPRKSTEPRHTGSIFVPKASLSEMLRFCMAVQSTRPMWTIEISDDRIVVVMDSDWPMLPSFRTEVRFKIDSPLPNGRRFADFVIIGP